jgi:hypothetical protein
VQGNVPSGNAEVGGTTPFYLNYQGVVERKTAKSTGRKRASLPFLAQVNFDTSLFGATNWPFTVDPPIRNQVRAKFSAHFRQESTCFLLNLGAGRFLVARIVDYGVAKRFSPFQRILGRFVSLKL